MDYMCSCDVAGFTAVERTTRLWYGSWTMVSAHWSALEPSGVRNPRTDTSVQRLVFVHWSRSAVAAASTEHRIESSPELGGKRVRLLFYNAVSCV
jgi:hypothetical protein